MNLVLLLCILSVGINALLSFVCWSVYMMSWVVTHGRRYPSAREGAKAFRYDRVNCILYGWLRLAVLWPCVTLVYLFCYNLSYVAHIQQVQVSIETGEGICK